MSVSKFPLSVRTLLYCIKGLFFTIWLHLNQLNLQLPYLQIRLHFEVLGVGTLIYEFLGDVILTHNNRVGKDRAHALLHGMNIIGGRREAITMTNTP